MSYIKSLELCQLMVLCLAAANIKESNRHYEAGGFWTDHLQSTLHFDGLRPRIYHA